MQHPNPSRRTFLKSGSAAIVGAAVAGRFGFATEVADEYAGLKMGIQSYTLRDRSFDKMLEAMHDDLKLHNVELFGADLFANSPPPVLNKAIEKLKAAQVKALSFGVTGFSKNHDDNRRQFEFAKAMGMTNLSADPDPESFDSLDKLVDEYDITIGIHDHGPGSRYGKIQQIFGAVKDHNKKIGLCNDTGHFIRAGEDPLEALEKFKDRLYAVHLKDFKPNGSGGWQDVPLGEGKLNVDGVIKWLVDNKYAHGLFIEYEGGDPVNATVKCEERVKQAIEKAK